MEFIYTSDNHIKGKNPLRRTDNYYESCLQEFSEIVKLASQTQNKILIIGGDLLDSSNVANSIVDDILDIIEKANITVYVVYGNHDMIGGNISPSLSLYHMIRRSKNVNILLDIEDETCYIKGINYKFGIEEDLIHEGLMLPDSKKWKIAIPHAFITEKPFHPDVLHIQGKDLKTNADLILCSHFHSEFNFKINETQFVNVGAVGRMSITESKHEPKVIKVNTEKRSYEIITLKSAKKGEDIFDLTTVENKKSFEGNINTFIEDLENTKFQELSVVGKVIEIGKKINIEKEVIELIERKIGEIENV